MVKIRILPPKGLYHPVLPQNNGKLTFALCKTCAQLQKKTPCQCTDADKSMVCTWCTPEIDKAVEKGYKILEIN